MKEKILIALSDSTLADNLAYELSHEGFEPQLIQDGQAALEQMRANAPDLLIIDLHLPVINGYDVLNEKTLDRFITKIPVIIVSNTGLTIEMRRIPATTSIRDYVIRSHVEPEEIVQKVCTLFKKEYTPKHLKAETVQPKKDGKKILWVEDDKLLRTILTKKFEAAGHVVFTAVSGDEALEILAHEVPDVVILDMLLPGMTGLDVLEKIKTMDTVKHVPVIMLSNLSKQSDIEKSKKLGAQRFLVKAAVSLDKIVAEVEQLKKV